MVRAAITDALERHARQRSGEMFPARCHSSRATRR
jgi:hypothetical protein